jgi:hypothetical protein
MSDTPMREASSGTKELTSAGGVSVFLLVGQPCNPSLSMDEAFSFFWTLNYLRLSSFHPTASLKRRL